MATPKRQSSKVPAEGAKRGSTRRGRRQGQRAESTDRVASELLVEVLAEGGFPVPVPGAPSDREGLGGRRPALAAPTPAPAGHTADITDELGDSAQAFGDVLMSIGNAVALSQAALDEAAIESAKQLSATKLKVAIAVRQRLDEDGKLVAGEPEVETRELSLSNYILPTLHQWQHVALSMDLTVSELDTTSGLKVKSGNASASSGVGGFSAAGEFGYSSLNTESRLRSDFAEGTVRLDALLGPRDEFRFPEVADFAIGPQILVGQTASAGPPRQVTLRITLRRPDNSLLEGKPIDLRLPPELYRRLAAPSSGSLPADDPIVLTLAADFAKEPAQSHRVQIRFGDLTKTVNVTL